MDRAMGLLQTNTCVVCKGDTVYTSQQTGISPMLDWLSEEKDLRGGAAADKIVGKAAALLFVLAGVREVYGEVMSEAGYQALQAHGIPCTYGTLTPYIVNRQGTGMCPMEQTVLTIDDPKTAFRALLQKREELRNKTHHV